MKMSLSTLVFFQVLCYQIPCFIQQYIHIFLGFPFIVEILYASMEALLVDLLAKLNFRWI